VNEELRKLFDANGTGIPFELGYEVSWEEEVENWIGATDNEIPREYLPQDV
jgi:hypothetical protein